MKRIYVLCLVICFAVAAFAQEKAATTKKAPAKAAAAQPGGMPPMPKPGPEMNKLISTLSGEYTATMTMDAMMGMPAMKSVGPARFYVGPGRLSLMETVNSVDEHGGKFSGHGVIWWDAKAAAYKGIWCDNGTPSGCMDGGDGKWDGEKLVTNGSMEMMGKQYTFKATYQDFTPEGFNYVMETAEGSAPLKKMFAIEYKKAPAKTTAPGK
jgi:hypothetical protein